MHACGTCLHVNAVLGRKKLSSNQRLVAAVLHAIACADRVWWRRGSDSNPRYGITVHRISSPAHSTTLPPLLIRFAWCEGRNSNPSWLEYLQPAHIGPQNLGHHHGTVLLLVVLQHRDQRPAHGQAGTVE